MNQITALTVKGFAAGIPEPGIDAAGKDVLKLDVFCLVKGKDGMVSKKKRFLPQIVASGSLASKIKDVREGYEVQVTGKFRESVRHFRGKTIASTILEASDFSILSRTQSKYKTSEKQRKTDFFEIGM